MGPRFLHVGEHHRSYGLRVGYPGPGSEDDVLDYALEGMPYGKDGKEGVSREDMQDRREEVRLVEEVAVAQHDALGFASRARRVNDGREIAASTRYHGLLVFGRPSGGSRGAKGAYLGEGPNEESGGLCRRGDLGRGILEQQGHRKSGNFGPVRDYLAELLLVLEDGDPAFAEAQYVGYFLFGGIAAAGNVRGAETEYRKIGYEPFPSVVGNEANMVAPGHTELEKASGEYLYVRKEGGICPGLESSGPVFRILSRNHRIGSHALEEHLGNGVGHVGSFYVYILTSDVRLCN